MKHEEMSDISTILVEPTDEKSSVVRHVSMQKKPVVIVLPENASRVFQHPGDFGELRRIKRYLGTPITLVIQRNDRLRVLARRHGLPVYSSTEALARTLAPQDTEPLKLQPLAATGKLKPQSAGSFARRRRSPITEPLAQSIQRVRPGTAQPRLGKRDTILFVLLLFLLLGILGGIGFGYLLAMTHSTPALLSNQVGFVGLFW